MTVVLLSYFKFGALPIYLSSRKEATFVHKVSRSKLNISVTVLNQPDYLGLEEVELGQLDMTFLPLIQKKKKKKSGCPNST